VLGRTPVGVGVDGVVDVVEELIEIRTAGAEADAARRIALGDAPTTVPLAIPNTRALAPMSNSATRDL